ncbi:MAG: AAA family ATPase [Clostridia bacterium]|nr:AAA family ATPase [Clostridia bacterium]
MKNLIIIGPPRCGKTTLVQMIASKYPCEIIRTDSIEITICQALLHDRLHESLKAESNVLVYPTLDENFKIELYHRFYTEIKTELKNQKKLIIMDAYNLSFSLLEKAFGNEAQIYCLGVTNLTDYEFINYIRLNDTIDDWTNYIGNNSLQFFCNRIIDESKAAKEELENFPNIKFFDTSGNRREKLKEIFEDIEQNVIQA